MMPAKMGYLEYEQDNWRCYPLRPAHIMGREGEIGISLNDRTSSPTVAKETDTGSLTTSGNVFSHT